MQLKAKATFLAGVILASEGGLGSLTGCEGWCQHPCLVTSPQNTGVASDAPLPLLARRRVNMNRACDRPKRRGHYETHHFIQGMHGNKGTSICQRRVFRVGVVLSKNLPFQAELAHA